ncbi:hypothetical protein ACRALDRAFT_211213, partial [Sodiomyces alcalophilus JCM 7366]|uniref:uncharacterized protein n=1 Tax=Sodiomyces alcalophilus JCM 7366 TaxID=591952 RepID=UPI0039B44A0F
SGSRREGGAPIFSGHMSHSGSHIRFRDKRSNTCVSHMPPRQTPCPLMYYGLYNTTYADRANQGGNNAISFPGIRVLLVGPPDPVANSIDSGLLLRGIGRGADIDKHHFPNFPVWTSRPSPWYIVSCSGNGDRGKKLVGISQWYMGPAVSAQRPPFRHPFLVAMESHSHTMYVVHTTYVMGENLFLPSHLMRHRYYDIFYPVPRGPTQTKEQLFGCEVTLFVNANVPIVDHGYCILDNYSRVPRYFWGFDFFPLSIPPLPRPASHSCQQASVQTAIRAAADPRHSWPAELMSFFLGFLAKVSLGSLERWEDTCQKRWTLKKIKLKTGGCSPGVGAFTLTNFDRRPRLCNAILISNFAAYSTSLRPPRELECTYIRSVSHRDYESLSIVRHDEGLQKPDSGPAYRDHSYSKALLDNGR